MPTEEEALDNVMVQSWQAVAQSLRQSAVRISNDLRETQRMRDQSRISRMRQLDLARRQLSTWKASQHATLNKGFAAVLRSTILNPNVLPERLTNDDLAKGWMVADQMDDVRYVKDKLNAKRTIEHEWSSRGIDQKVSDYADNLVNHVHITAVGPSEELNATLDAFQSSGAQVKIEFIDPGEADKFLREHNDCSFHVDTTQTGSWDGLKQDKVAQAILTSGTSDPNKKIAYIRSQINTDLDNPSQLNLGQGLVDAAHTKTDGQTKTTSHTNSAIPQSNDVQVTHHESAKAASKTDDNTSPVQRSKGDPFGELTPSQEVSLSRQSVSNPIVQNGESASIQQVVPRPASRTSAKA